MSDKNGKQSQILRQGKRVSSRMRELFNLIAFDVTIEDKRR